MGTSSRIGFENSDGTISCIDCGSDGYPSHTGRRLVENFNTIDKVGALITLGNLSILGSKIGEFHDPRNRPQVARDEDWCCARGRDGCRGAEGKHDVHPNEADFGSNFEEYNYLFRNGEWLVLSHRFPTREWYTVVSILEGESHE